MFKTHFGGTRILVKPKNGAGTPPPRASYFSVQRFKFEGAVYERPRQGRSW